MIGIETKVLLLISALLLSGLPANVGAEETITGRLDMHINESGRLGPISAYVEQLDQTSGRIRMVHILGWDVLPDLPLAFKSGAIVSVTGTRDSVPGTSGALTATHVEVITPPPLRPVSVSAARMGVKSSKLTVGNNLKVLVLRPRLPQGCKLGRRVGGGRKKEWKKLLAKVNNLQTSCTNGLLSYQEPVVTDYIDIPCTKMGSKDYYGCDLDAMAQWYADAVSYAKTNLSIDTESFRHVMGDLPVQEGCAVMGLGVFDDNQLYYNGFTIRRLYGDFLHPENVLTIAHEMGHNYGLPHTDRLQLGSNGALPKGWEKQIGTDDRTSIMGYDNLLSCFNFPESAAIGLMSAKQYRPKSLPAGKGVKLRLKPNWGPPPQGAVVATGKKGQKDLRVWFSYILSTDSGFQDGNSTLLLDSTFNKAVVLYVTSTKIRYNTQRFSYSHRVWTMQSGEAARWPVTGLVFKYVGVSKAGQQANIWLCRETARKKCRLRNTPPPLGDAVQLRLAAVRGEFCLQACNSIECRQPATGSPERLDTVYFASKCSGDSTTLWRPMTHTSGFRRYMNVATGECLTVRFDEKDTEATNVYWRVALEACNTEISLDLRTNPQRFLPTNPQKDPTADPVQLQSPLHIPGCANCGTVALLCVGARIKVPPRLSAASADTEYASAAVSECRSQDEFQVVREVSPA